MKQLPSRGWGPWRQEFYSLYSSPDSQRADVNNEFGSWHNVWIQIVSSTVYAYWPNLWRWWKNLPPNRRRFVRKMNKFFPNMR